MRNCNLQWRPLSENLNPVDALNHQAIIDKKGYFNHKKLTTFTRAINSSNNNGKIYKFFNPAKREPGLNIEKLNSCMK